MLGGTETRGEGGGGVLGSLGRDSGSASGGI